MGDFSGRFGNISVLLPEKLVLFVYLELKYIICFDFWIKFGGVFWMRMSEEQKSERVDDALGHKEWLL